MKIFHTADWHLGKLIQGVYMTEDQRYVLEQFVDAVENEKPDAVIIAGDLYDRAVPPTEAVHLLDDLLKKIVLDLKTPVLAVAGNHDSPGRLNFGSSIMRENGLHIVGNFTDEVNPVVLSDDAGEVHFHLVPYCDPSIVRNVFGDDDIRTHNEAMKKIVENINAHKDSNSRHVFVGHAFVTPYGQEEENTSDSERPLSIGGAEYVDAHHFTSFHYTALGHLHRANHVLHENIRYAGSPLKYSISEEYHKKGYFIVEMDGDGEVHVEKKLLTPRRDLRRVEAMMDDILSQPVNEDYVFIRLLDEAPVLSPMEKIRSVYPNAMHVERENFNTATDSREEHIQLNRSKMNEFDLFRAFYKEVKGVEASEETEEILIEVLEEMGKEEAEMKEKPKELTTN